MISPNFFNAMLDKIYIILTHFNALAWLSSIPLPEVQPPPLMMIMSYQSLCL